MRSLNVIKIAVHSCYNVHHVVGRSPSSQLQLHIYAEYTQFYCGVIIKKNIHINVTARKLLPLLFAAAALARTIDNVKRFSVVYILMKIISQKFISLSVTSLSLSLSLWVSVQRADVHCWHCTSYTRWHKQQELQVTSRKPRFKSRQWRKILNRRWWCDCMLHGNILKTLQTKDRQRIKVIKIVLWTNQGGLWFYNHHNFAKNCSTYSPILSKLNAEITKLNGKNYHFYIKSST